MKITTAFKEGNIDESGWTSQYSFIPELMLSLNNRFFTVKNGQLFLHNDRNNPVRNNFYGEQFGSSVTTIFNDFNSEDKIFKTLVLESDQKWKAELLTNYTNGIINANEFETKESRQFSFIRGNEGASMHGNAPQGIGTIQNIDTQTVFFTILPELISVGDTLFQIDAGTKVEIGRIDAIDTINNTMQINTFVNVPTIGFYSYAMKNSRIEGESIRGHYLEVKLINDDATEGELFAISSNSVKSYV